MTSLPAQRLAANPGSYRDLAVWQKAIDLIVAVYELTTAFPRHEQYGLTSQMRRAAVSVAGNIVEGRGRLSRAEFARHAAIARGSVTELDAYFEIAIRLNYVSAADPRPARELADESSRMLLKLVRALRKRR